MINDRDVIEENSQLLLGRWRLLAARPDDSGRLGMEPRCAAELCALADLQVKRAADCSTPLFRFSQPDAILAKVLEAKAGERGASLQTEADALIETENELLLVNRWNAARVSPLHCESLLGLSTFLVERLRAATIGDLRQAARRGVRLCGFGAGHQYLFHAGRNPALHRSNRTVLAVCASAGRPR